MSDQNPKNSRSGAVHINLNSIFTPEEIAGLSDDELSNLVVQILASMADEQSHVHTVNGSQTQTQSRTDTEITYPKRYNVIFLNDDYTPMDFVIQLLVEIFNKNIDQAQEITMAIHNEGSAVVGTYSREIAEQKTHEAVLACQHSGHPLEILCEPM
jgi:ATP-dependent Clp protease adaptor protein ClpS